MHFQNESKMIDSLIKPEILQLQHDRVGDEEMLLIEDFPVIVCVVPRDRCSNHPETDKAATIVR